MQSVVSPQRSKKNKEHSFPFFGGSRLFFFWAMIFQNQAWGMGDLELISQYSSLTVEQTVVRHVAFYLFIFSFCQASLRPAFLRPSILRPSILPRAAV